MRTIIEDLRPFKNALTTNQEHLLIEISGAQEALARNYSSFLSYSDFMREVNNEERNGMSICALIRRKDEIEGILHDLNKGDIKPAKVIGRGYAKPRNVAYTYLHESAVTNAIDVCSGGFTSYINLRNYLTYLIKFEI